MTKEELEKEATAYALKWGDKTDGTYACCRDGYLAGAEPREKEIKSLGERCLQLQKDKGNLTDSVRDLEEKLANADYQLEGRDLEIKELKAQIEKMKCCLFCAYRNMDWNFSSICIQKDNAKIENPYTCKCDKWEIKK